MNLKPPLPQNQCCINSSFVLQKHAFIENSKPYLVEKAEQDMQIGMGHSNSLRVGVVGSTLQLAFVELAVYHSLLQAKILFVITSCVGKITAEMRSMC